MHRSGRVPFDPGFCFVPASRRCASSVQNRRSANTTVEQRTFLYIFFFCRVWRVDCGALLKHTNVITFLPICFLVVGIWIDQIYSSSVRQQTRGASTHLCCGCVVCTLWTYCPLTPRARSRMWKSRRILILEDCQSQAYLYLQTAQECKNALISQY